MERISAVTTHHTIKCTHSVCASVIHSPPAPSPSSQHQLFASVCGAGAAVGADGTYHLHPSRRGGWAQRGILLHSIDLVFPNLRIYHRHLMLIF